MNNPAPNSLSPIQLQSLTYTEVHISAQSDGKPNGVSATNAAFEAFPLDLQKENWQVGVKVDIVQIGEIKPFYLGTILAIGIVQIVASIPEDRLEKVVTVNGAGMVYSAIREMVCNITARGPWGPLMLITQNFLVAYEEGQARARETAPSPVADPYPRR
jgi:hypothetical protein